MVKISRVKQRTYYLKKRRGVFRKEEHIISEINVNNSLVNNVKNNDTSVADASSINVMDLSSSSQKVKIIEASTQKEKEKISGYRLIDASILSHVFKLVLCPRCSMSTLSLGDKVSKKQGLSSLLRLNCLNCDFYYEFYTS